MSHLAWPMVSEGTAQGIGFPMSGIMACRGRGQGWQVKFHLICFSWIFGPGSLPFAFQSMDKTPETICLDST